MPLGEIGGLNLKQVEKRLEKLDDAIEPFASMVEIIQARFEAMSKPAERALDAINRQIDRNLQAVIDGSEQAASLVRSLDSSHELIKDRVDSQQSLVDKATIQLELMKAQQAEERALLNIQKARLEGDEQAVTAAQQIAKAASDAVKAADEAADGAGGSGGELAGELLPDDFLGGVGEEQRGIIDELIAEFELGYTDAYNTFVDPETEQPSLVFGLQNIGKMIADGTIFGDLKKNLKKYFVKPFEDAINSVLNLFGLGTGTGGEGFSSVPSDFNTDFLSSLRNRLFNIGERVKKLIDELILQPIRDTFGNEEGIITFESIGEAIDEFIADLPNQLANIETTIRNALGYSYAPGAGENRKPFADILDETILAPFNAVFSKIAQLLTGDDNAEVNIARDLQNFVESIPEKLEGLRDALHTHLYLPFVTSLRSIFTGESQETRQARNELASTLGQSIADLEYGPAPQNLGTFLLDFIDSIPFYASQLGTAINTHILTPIGQSIASIFGNEDGEVTGASIGKALDEFVGVTIPNAFASIGKSITDFFGIDVNSLLAPTDEQVKKFGEQQDKILISSGQAYRKAFNKERQRLEEENYLLGPDAFLSEQEIFDRAHLVGAEARKAFADTGLGGLEAPVAPLGTVIERFVTSIPTYFKTAMKNIEDDFITPLREGIQGLFLDEKGNAADSIPGAISNFVNVGLPNLLSGIGTTIHDNLLKPIGLDLTGLFSIEGSAFSGDDLQAAIDLSEANDRAWAQAQLLSNAEHELDLAAYAEGRVGTFPGSRPVLNRSDFGFRLSPIARSIRQFVASIPRFFRGLDESILAPFNDAATKIQAFFEGKQVDDVKQVQIGDWIADFLENIDEHLANFGRIVETRIIIPVRDAFTRLFDPEGYRLGLNYDAILEENIILDRDTTWLGSREDFIKAGKEASAAAREAAIKAGEATQDFGVFTPFINGLLNIVSVLAQEAVDKFIEGVNEGLPEFALNIRNAFARAFVGTPFSVLFPLSIDQQLEDGGINANRYTDEFQARLRENYRDIEAGNARSVKTVFAPLAEGFENLTGIDTGGLGLLTHIEGGFSDKEIEAFRNLPKLSQDVFQSLPPDEKPVLLEGLPGYNAQAIEDLYDTTVLKSQSEPLTAAAAIGTSIGTQIGTGMAAGIESEWGEGGVGPQTIRTALKNDAVKNAANAGATTAAGEWTGGWGTAFDTAKANGGDLYTAAQNVADLFIAESPIPEGPLGGNKPLRSGTLVATTWIKGFTSVFSGSNALQKSIYETSVDLIGIDQTRDELGTLEEFMTGTSGLKDLLSALKFTIEVALELVDTAFDDITTEVKDIIDLIDYEVEASLGLTDTATDDLSTDIDAIDTESSQEVELTLADNITELLQSKIDIAVKAISGSVDIGLDLAGTAIADLDTSIVSPLSGIAKDILVNFILSDTALSDLHTSVSSILTDYSVGVDSQLNAPDTSLVDTFIDTVQQIKTSVSELNIDIVTTTLAAVFSIATKVNSIDTSIIGTTLDTLNETIDLSFTLEEFAEDNLQLDIYDALALVSAMVPVTLTDIAEDELLRFSQDLDTQLATLSPAVKVNLEIVTSLQGKGRSSEGVDDGKSLLERAAEGANDMVRGYLTGGIPLLETIYDGVFNALLGTNQPTPSSADTPGGKELASNVLVLTIEDLINLLVGEEIVSLKSTLEGLESNIPIWIGANIGTVFQQSLVDPVQSVLDPFITWLVDPIGQGNEGLAYWMAIFFAGSEDEFGTVSSYILALVETFEDMPTRVFTALSTFGPAIWEGMGKPLVKLLDYLTGELNGFIRNLNRIGGSEALKTAGISFGSLPLLSRVESFSIPDFLIAKDSFAARGGLFGPGSLLVGEKGPEIITPAQKIAVLPNQLTNLMLRHQQVQPRPYARPIYHSNNYTTYNTTNHYDHSMRTNFHGGESRNARSVDQRLRNMQIRSRYRGV